MNLFEIANETENNKFQPLAEKMRPQKLADFEGQEKILKSLGKIFLFIFL